MRLRGIIIIINKDIINNIYSNEPNLTQVTRNDNSAIELALKYNI